MAHILRVSLDPTERRIIASTLVASIIIFVSYFAWAYGPVATAYWNYQPQEGDIFFQSLPNSLLAKMMEGATDSPYSHCGIITKVNNEWVVYEAHQKVRTTPLIEAIFRGRNYGFAIYRLKADKQSAIGPMLQYIDSQKGKPFDTRFRLEDDELYSSELLYKAYRQATGQSLGKLSRLGQLRWKPYEETIKYFERGPAPLRREIITPKSLSQAPELELITAFRIDKMSPNVSPTDSKATSKPK